MKKIAILLIAFTLSGCIRFKDYESVTSGPKAKITFKKSSEVSEVSFIISGCNKHNDANPGNTELALEHENSKTVFVSPGRKYISVNPWDKNGYHLPFSAASIVAEENKDYTFEYSYHDPVNSWLGSNDTGTYGVIYKQNFSDNTSKLIDMDNPSTPCEVGN